MAPRGEAALIIAGIALASGVLDNRSFGVIILMTFITTPVSPPLLSAFLKMKGMGTGKAAKGGDTVSEVWEFSSREIAGMVVDALFKGLRNKGFYVQTMNMDEGLSQEFVTLRA
jgi:Kef-type K+ transport system membrane component KefB